MRWRDKIARFLGLNGGRTRRDGVRAWPADDDIDPIEELARIINAAQESDAKDERRFDDLAPIDKPKAAARRPRRARPF
jgi:hypothetical protein